MFVPLLLAQPNFASLAARPAIPANRPVDPNAAHPRLLIRAAELPQLRLHVAGIVSKDAAWPAMARLRQTQQSSPKLSPQPAAIGRSAQQIEIARTSWREVSRAASQAQLLAFRWLLEDNPGDRQTALQTLSDLSQLPASDTLSYRHNPESFVQALHGMAFAFDWLYTSLDAQDRTSLTSALARRLDILFGELRRLLKDDGPLQPAEGLSHPVRFVSTLGHAAMALQGHHAQADQALAWVCRFYLTRFPVWGGDDGGWSEGLEYHSSGLSQHLRLVEDLARQGMPELLQRPFWRNTGYFLASFLPPYESSSFSDLPRPPRPTASRHLLLRKLGHLLQDPMLLRLAQRYGKALPAGADYYQFGAIDTLLHSWRTADDPPAALPDLAALPRSRHFADVGWVSLQSGWDDRGNTIMLGFKSSPVGTVSHGFADQNAFVINAYRHAMAVSTGVRDWYGSPHYEGWTRAAKSKNTVLVDGQGPPVRAAGAKGRITRFASTANGDVVSGDASAAYQALAARVQRHIVFVDRRFFVVLDEIDGLPGAAPLRHQWLLHSRVAMRLDAALARIDAAWPDAGLSAQVLLPTPADLDLRQTDRHAPPPEPSETTESPVPAEWHVTAEARQPATNRRFLTVLTPWQGAAPPPLAMALLPATAGHVLQVGGQTVLMSDSRSGRAIADGLELQGAAGWTDARRMVLLDGTLLRSAGLALASSVRVNLELSKPDQDNWTLSVGAHPGLSLQISGIDQPSRLDLPAGASWTFTAPERRVALRLPPTAAAQAITLAWRGQ